MDNFQILHYFVKDGIVYYDAIELLTSICGITNKLKEITETLYLVRKNLYPEEKDVKIFWSELDIYRIFPYIPHNVYLANFFSVQRNLFFPILKNAIQGIPYALCFDIESVESYIKRTASEEFKKNIKKEDIKRIVKLNKQYFEILQNAKTDIPEEIIYVSICDVYEP